MSDFDFDELKVMSIEGDGDTCPSVSYQKVGVSVPVTIRPIANVGVTDVKCCGEAIILPGPHPCNGKKNGICSFTINQTLLVEVPIEFGAVVTVGETYVDCKRATSDDICTNCDKDYEE